MDILVVVSKIKKLIKEESGMNTSSSATDAISAMVHKACKEACENARRDGRKTVMDRDFES